MPRCASRSFSRGPSALSQAQSPSSAAGPQASPLPCCRYVVDQVSKDGYHKTMMVWQYDKRPRNGSQFVYFGVLPCSAHNRRSLSQTNARASPHRNGAGQPPVQDSTVADPIHPLRTGRDPLQEWAEPQRNHDDCARPVLGRDQLPVPWRQWRMDAAGLSSHRGLQPGGERRRSPALGLGLRAPPAMA